MRPLAGSLVALFVVLVMAPRAASAQTGAWTDRVRVSINVGVQPSSTTFTGSTTAPVYLETSTINTTYGVSKGQLFDGGILVRVTGRFGVGVAVSSFGKEQDGTVSGSIPHPFFFNMPRPIAGTATGLQRSEVAAHVEAAYVISSKRMDLALSAGPSFFRVGQDLVANVTYTATYPYDTVTFTSATIERATAMKVGFNAGADIGIRFARHVGIGGLVRFSRASVSFPLTGSPGGVSAKAGGPQVTGGLRFFF